MMLRLCLFTLSLYAATSTFTSPVSASLRVAPKPPANLQGPYLWPHPRNITTGSTAFHISPSFEVIYSTNFDVGQHLLGATTNRFKLFTFPYVTQGYVPTDTTGEMTSVYVHIVQDSSILNYDTLEHYNLTISATGAVRIDAETCFGAMYGLQTLSQLIEYSSTPQPHYRMPYGPVDIIDRPRFGWRGLMIDTSRHFLSPTTIQRIIIAMHLNKLNTLHWHVSDSYSFPLQSTLYPNLTIMGAYDETAVYSPTDVQAIITFGHDRGVRVLPEFDVPGHAAGMAQWNETLAACPQFLNSGYPGVEMVALDPTSNWTYTFIRTFLAEQAAIFPADFFHLGGNDVREECFLSNPTIVAWMEQNDMTVSDVIRHFWAEIFTQVVPTLTAQNITLTMWADKNWSYNAAVNVTLQPIYQVFETQSTLYNVTSAGYNAITSAGWILNADEQDGTFTTWQEMYEIDPQELKYLENNASLTAKVLGGEALLWGSEASDFSIDTILWPRVSAVAERLWSPAPTGAIDWNATQWRLDVQSCRMSRRRIRASPSIPGFCLFANDYVAPTWPEIGLTYAAFYTLIGLSVVGGLYILAVIVKQIAVVRATASAKKASHVQEEHQALLS